LLLIGLTGSIGMGKSETAKMFKRLGVSVYDADAAVHDLYGVGGAAVQPIEDAFPGVTRDGAIDRSLLSKQVVGKASELAKLEAIVHPLVGQAQMDFLQSCDEAGKDMVALDIPLLFETGGEARVDVIVVVSASYKIQRQRVLARKDMTPEKFAAILAKQVPDAEKRARADFVVDTSKGKKAAFVQVEEIVAKIKSRTGEVWRERQKQMR